MARIYMVDGLPISVDDVEAVRSLSPEQFGDLLRQTYTDPNPEPNDVEVPLKQPPPGTCFIIMNPPQPKEER